MQRRKFLVGMGSLAAGGAATMGTGAFSGFTATRNHFTSVTEADGDGYLGIATANDTYSWAPNNDVAAYAKGNPDPIEINLSLNGGSAQGEGVNPNSLTNILGLLAVRNQGSQPVDVYITKDGGTNPDRVGFFGNSGSPNEGKPGDIASSNNMVGPSNGFTLTVGESGIISVQVDTQEDSASSSATKDVAGNFSNTGPLDGQSGGTILQDIVFNAEA